MKSSNFRLPISKFMALTRTSDAKSKSVDLSDSSSRVLKPILCIYLKFSEKEEKLIHNHFSGKTLQMISLIASQKERRQLECHDLGYKNHGVSKSTLVVAPASVMNVWLNEIEKHCRRTVMLSVCLFHGNHRVRHYSIAQWNDPLTDSANDCLNLNQVLYTNFRVTISFFPGKECKHRSLGIKKFVKPVRIGKNL